MISRTLTITDLCQVTGYTRYQLRGLLDEMLPEKRSKGPRVARVFSAQELLVIATISDLESRFGIKRAHISLISKRLSQVLSGPRLMSRQARLVITFSPPSVSYVTAGTPSTDAVILSLGPIFERVDRYLTDGPLSDAQRQLGFRPASVVGPRARSQLSRG